MIVRGFGLTLAGALLATCLTTGSVEAGDTRRSSDQPGATNSEGGHRASKYYRRGPQVRGYVQRRGGYSFSSNDVINTYGDSRSLYGGANSYRDRMLDRQTSFGPFDHGFFFDSGISLRGGNAPYPN